jgi:hypothetical protein
MGYRLLVIEGVELIKLTSEKPPPPPPEEGSRGLRMERLRVEGREYRV